MQDLISRQAVIDTTWFEPSYTDPLNVLTEVRDRLKALPSAQLERKKGRWVEFDSDEDKFDIIKCSCCKHTFTVDSYHWTDIGFVKDDFNFCPNCGADMRGEQDE